MCPYDQKSPAKADRVHSWLDETPAMRGQGRPYKHYGNAAERHRAAQASYARRGKWKPTPEQRREERAVRAEYMRRYRADNPQYVDADNRRRRSQGVGASSLVPKKLDGLSLNPSTLRALTARSVDYSSPEMIRLMEENPELASQVLARYAIGLALIAKVGFFGPLMAGSVFGTLPGVGKGRRKGRRSTFDKEWRQAFSPIVPLGSEGPSGERCASCGASSFAEDMGRAERFCVNCGVVAGNEPRLVTEQSPSTREH